jgi:hypothetical protein
MEEKTIEELEKEVAAAKTLVDDLDAQLANPKLSDSDYDALLIKRNNADDTLTDLTGERDKLKRTQGLTETGSKNAQDFAKKQVGIFEGRYEKALKEFNKNPSSKGLAKGYSTRDKLKEAGTNLNSAYNNADEAGLQLPRIIKPTTDGGFVPADEQAETPTATPGRVLTPAESRAYAEGLAPDKPTVITDKIISEKIVVPKGAVSVDKIVAQLELRGLPDTPENRKTIRQELVKQPGLSSDWKERFIAEYPQYAQYLTDPMYGDDVTQVFQRAMEEQWFKYGDVGLSVFARELGKTAYGLKTNSTQKAFDAKTMADQNKSVSDQLDLIRSTYGNFGQNGDTPGLSDQELFNLARESARNGYTNEQQKRAIYSYVYNADPTADRTSVIARIEAGKVGQDVNKIYNDYLLAPDKNAIKRYATGEITLEDVKREARALTSTMYPALKQLIDQGVSVKAISDQYAATAGTILEKDDTTINMADAQYRVAFSGKDAAGNPSLMSLGDWQTMLKTNADYGWQYTKAANSQALDTATMIARTFGKVQ